MSGQGSPYGKGFAIRMTILLAILGLGVAGFFYDQTLQKSATEKITEVRGLLNEPTDDGQGIPVSQVDELIGSSATKTTYTHVQEKPEGMSDADWEAKVKRYKPKEYLVHEYNFKRVLPMIKGQRIDVVFDNKALVYVQEKEAISKERLNQGFDPVVVPVDGVPEEMRPQIGGMGAAGGGGNRGGNRGGNQDRSEGRPNNDNDDDSKEDEKEESEKEDVDADKNETEEGGSEEKKEGDKKEGDKEEGDKEEGDKEEGDKEESSEDEGN